VEGHGFSRAAKAASGLGFSPGGDSVRAEAKALCGGLFRRAEARRFHRREGHYFYSNQQNKAADREALV